MQNFISDSQFLAQVIVRDDNLRNPQDLRILQMSSFSFWLDEGS